MDKMLKYSALVLAVFSGMAFISSCIKNDINYPVIVPYITAFEVSGQLEEPIIDSRLQTIKLSLADSVDIYNVRVIKCTLVNDPEGAPEAGSLLDLSSDLAVKLTTYQDYVWTISASQDVERYIDVENQVGTAIFNEAAKQAVVYVAKSQPLDQIKVRSMKLGPEGSTLTPEPTSVTDFSNSVTFTMEFRSYSQEWTVTVISSSVEVVTNDVNPWATFAYLEGGYVAGGDTPGFEYRRVGDATWTYTGDVDISGGTFTARIKGLQPSTRYEFRATSGDMYASTVEFTTEDALQVPNMSFDDWCYTTKSNGHNIYYPNKDIESNYWWDSGNESAATANINPTTEETTVVVKGSAAKLQAAKVLNVIASGSIYTGKVFNTVYAPPSAELDFGRPYSCRPTRMTGYYNYTPGQIDMVRSPWDHFVGRTDSCHVYVILSDKGEPYRINNATNSFQLIDFQNDPYIIAFGEHKTNKNTDGYEQFTIELEYRSLTRIPNHVVIVGTSCKYGDYFTGSTVSLLYLDEFAFEFD